MDVLPRLSGHALVVEDDAFLALDMAEMLTDLGIERVETCASTADAMVRLAQFCPTIVTLDVNLADRQDGWALAELAQQTSETPPIIIFATGSPELVPARIAQMGYVIGKPVKSADLHAILRQADKDRGLLGRLRRILG
jgi:CheY-like chemotaxis protein